MRIVIDLQGAQTRSRFRGIGRYTLSLTRAMLRARGDHQIILVLNGQLPLAEEAIRKDFENILPRENIVTWHAPAPTATISLGNKWRYAVATLIREAFIESLQPDWIHISSMLEGYGDSAVTSIGKFDRKTPVSVSIYDLIPLTNQEDYLEPYPLFRQFYLEQVEQLKHAQVLLAISEFSRQEAIKYLALPTETVVNISSAADSIFRPLPGSDDEATARLQEAGITRPFVLYTGGADIRKNLPLLIHAFAALPAGIRSRHQLVFAGKLLDIESSQLRREAKSAGLASDEFILTGYVSDSDLIQMYSRCSLYVFPSWHEGFGLPALEAMSCGAPVICADSSSLVEVVANPAALFDPFSESALAEKMARALADPAFRQALVENGKIQSARFSWEGSASTALKAIEACSPDNSPPRDGRDIIPRLLDALAEVETGKMPTEIELARIADCIEKNVRAAKSVQ